MGPLLSAFCDGEAGDREETVLREHLRACAELSGDPARLPGGAAARRRRWRRRCRSTARCSSAPTTRSPGWRLASAAVASDSGHGPLAGRRGRRRRGRRIAALAKVVAVCVGTAGGAAACVATGVVPAPLDLGPSRRRCRRWSAGSNRSSAPRAGRRVRRTNRRRRRRLSRPAGARARGGRGCAPVPHPRPPSGAVEYTPPEPRRRPGTGRANPVRAGPAAAARPGSSGRERRQAAPRAGGNRRLAREPPAAPRPTRPRSCTRSTCGWSEAKRPGMRRQRLPARLGPTADRQPGLSGRRRPLPRPRRLRRDRRPRRPGCPGTRPTSNASTCRRCPASTRRTSGWRGRTTHSAPRSAPPCASTTRGQAPSDRWPRQGGSPATLRRSSRSNTPTDPYRPPGFAATRSRSTAAAAADPAPSRVAAPWPRPTSAAAIGDDTISLGGLPEGVSVVRVRRRLGLWGQLGRRRQRDRPSRRDPPRGRRWPGSRRAGPTVRCGCSRRATDALSGMAANGPGGPYTAIAVDGGVPKIGAGRLDRDHGDRRGDAPGRRLRPRRRRQHQRQARPQRQPSRSTKARPRVTFARTQDPTEPERTRGHRRRLPLRTQPGAGARSRCAPAGSRQRWLPLPTTTAPGRLVARWDSDSFPAGTYEFRATGYDAAGNTSSSERRGNGTRMVLTNPLKAPDSAARPGSASAAARRARIGAVTARGARLRRPAEPRRQGRRWVGMPVRVVESFDARQPTPPSASTLVQTAADGTFSTRLPPGPSRRVEAVFAGSRRSQPQPTAARAQLTVRGRRSPAGFRRDRPGRRRPGRSSAAGSAISAPRSRPAAGRSSSSFASPEGPGREFRTVQTDARGRFRYAYSFSDDDSRGVRFQFRAYATGGGWPYEPAASKPVTRARAAEFRTARAREI